MPPKRNNKNEIIFKDYPDFKPNLTPKEMFELGSFGGTYWRPIYSSVTQKSYKNQHKEFPKSWFSNIPQSWLTNSWEEYDVNINTYKVKVGTTLEEWEDAGWMHPQDPYGWVQWYCRFYAGRRTPEEDERQIKRWLQTAGPKSRFRVRLINMIKSKGSKVNDFSTSPKIRQTLQHWGYVLNSNDL